MLFANDFLIYLPREGGGVPIVCYFVCITMIMETNNHEFIPIFLLQWVFVFYSDVRNESEFTSNPEDVFFGIQFRSFTRVVMLVLQDNEFLRISSLFLKDKSVFPIIVKKTQNIAHAKSSVSNQKKIQISFKYEMKVITFARCFTECFNYFKVYK